MNKGNIPKCALSIAEVFESRRRRSLFKYPVGLTSYCAARNIDILSQPYVIHYIMIVYMYTRYCNYLYIYNPLIHYTVQNGVLFENTKL